MRKVIFFILMVVLGLHLQAQIVVSGGVKDVKNNPLQGATIAIKDSYDGGTTDSLGRFSFQTLEKGEHLLVISAIGYKSAEQKVILSQDQISIDIKLKEEINEMKAVVITAGSYKG